MIFGIIGLFIGSTISAVAMAFLKTSKIMEYEVELQQLRKEKYESQ